MGRRSAFVGRAGWMRAVFSLLLASGVLASCGSEERATAEATAAVRVPPERATCRRFTSCVPQNPCHTGWVTGCRGNEPICTDIGGWLSNGTTCGDAAVCYLGDCVPCAAGASCALLDMYGNPDLCRVGAIACGTGQPVCEQAGTAQDGTSCSSWGGPYVCKQGQCTWCQDGSWCALPDSPTCHQGVMTQCAETGGTCVATAVQNGTYCGDGQVCRDGSCVACAWSAPCDPGMACWSGGYTDCSSGSPTCVPNQPRPEGEPCGDALFCSGGGACVPRCVEGAPCTMPWNACATGTMSCWSLTSGQCVQGGTQRDGTACGDGLVCSGGWCQSCGPNFYCPPPTSCYGMGTLSCATGLCEPTGAPFADGTACGAGGETCQAGSCTGTPGAALVVRSSMGTVDLTNTRWSYCETQALLPRSQLRTDAYLAGGAVTHEEFTYESPDCSGDPIPGSGIFFDAVAVSAGDRTVGWESEPPPFALPSQLVATAVRFTGTVRGTGEPFDFRTLRYVSDGWWAGPRTIFEGKEDGGVAWDGYPTRLVTAYHTESPACVQDAPCDPGTATCNRWAIDCSGGTAQCTLREALPDGSSCGPGLECQATQCLPAPPPVSGSRTTTYWTDGGPLPQPVTAPLEALVPQPDGSFVVRSATVAPDGTFTIGGVPEGSYLLRVGGGFPLLLETAGRALDLGQDLAGRPGFARAPAGTQVTLALTNLAPWATRDVVELASSNTGSLALPFGQPTIPNVALGTTELTRTVEWGNLPLLDPVMGDSAIVFQDSAAWMPGSTTVGYRAATRWARFPGPILPSVSQTFALALEEPPAIGFLSATWPVPAWAAHATEVNPAGATGSSLSHRLAVMASPWGVTWTQNSLPFMPAPAPDLLTVSAPAGTAGDVTIDALSYGQVLPPPYVEYRDVRTVVRVAIPNPSGGSLTWSGQIVRVDRLDGALADAGPVVTPPLAPLIGGADAFTPQVGVGTGPTLSWSPPAVGAPTSYVVTVFAPVPGSTTSAFIRAIAKTTATSFRFPAGTLTAGEACFATITARQDPAERPDAPLRASLETDWASLVTAPFTP